MVAHYDICRQRIYPFLPPESSADKKAKKMPKEVSRILKLLHLRVKKWLILPTNIKYQDRFFKAY